MMLIGLLSLRKGRIFCAEILILPVLGASYDPLQPPQLLPPPPQLLPQLLPPLQLFQPP